MLAGTEPHTSKTVVSVNCCRLGQEGREGIKGAGEKQEHCTPIPANGVQFGNFIDANLQTHSANGVILQMQTYIPIHLMECNSGILQMQTMKN